VKRPGFTLVEALIGLGLSVFIAAAGCEFFVRAERTFLRLQLREEAGQAALAALDRICIDLLHAGRGLAFEVAQGLVTPAEATAEGELRLASLERTLALAADAAAGATRLTLVSTAGIAAGQTIVLRQGPSGEARTVTQVAAGTVLVDAPLERGYEKEAASLSLLELVTYFRDAAGRILRRRVNAGAAQPLLEGAAAALFSFEQASRLVRIRLELDAEGVHPHEATVFLKNPALAGNL
jgi:type II secretory pathway pseudopilin PulG